MRSKMVYVISADSEWSNLIMAGLALSLKSHVITCDTSVENLWNLSNDTLVIYDRATLGNPSAQLISPHSRGGAWIIVNATSIDLEGVQGLIALGYCGVIEAENTLELLHMALRTIISGQLWFSREAMSLSLRASMRKETSNNPSFEVVGSKFGLSYKEQKVFLYAVQGYSNKEIAGELNLSLSTVKTHISNILNKTGKQSRSQLNVLLVDSANGYIN